MFTGWVLNWICIYFTVLNKTECTILPVLHHFQQQHLKGIPFQPFMFHICATDWFSCRGSYISPALINAKISHISFEYCFFYKHEITPPILFLVPPLMKIGGLQLLYICLTGSVCIILECHFKEGNSFIPSLASNRYLKKVKNWNNLWGHD